MNTQYTVLAGRIQQALVDLERVVKRAESLFDKAQQSGDDGYLDGVALNLHAFYTGVEAIFEDIARNTEGVVPTGPNWHQELLLQMSAEMNGLRPPIITVETRYCLDEYRGFRHIVRNIYTFNLKGSRLQELTQNMHVCYDAIRCDLDKFVQVLEALTE